MKHADRIRLGMLKMKAAGVEPDAMHTNKDTFNVLKHECHRHAPSEGPDMFFGMRIIINEAIPRNTFILVNQEINDAQVPFQPSGGFSLFRFR